MGLDYKLLTRSGSVQHERNGPAVAATLDPPRAVIELVPESVARENQVLPLALDGETLTVAAADPTNLLVAEKLSFILNKKVRLVAAPPAAIRVAINRHYGRREMASLDSMLCEFTDTAIEFGDKPVAKAHRVRSPVRMVTEFKRGVRGLEPDFDESICEIANNIVSPDPRYPGLDPTP